jgi:two-component sensor histidine kinase
VRHLIAADLISQGILADCVDDVVLVASELVSNAVRHTPAAHGNDDLGVTWTVESDNVLIGVLDASPEMPHRRTTDETETRGRGLFIVATLAHEWGAQRLNEGKQVWARVPIVRE